MCSKFYYIIKQSTSPKYYKFSKLCHKLLHNIQYKMLQNWDRDIFHTYYILHLNLNDILIYVISYPKYYWRRVYNIYKEISDLNLFIPPNFDNLVI